jgi:hypothetical protein
MSVQILGLMSMIANTIPQEFLVAQLKHAPTPMKNRLWKEGMRRKKLKN